MAAETVDAQTTVIQEISDQLGMAVDATKDFVTDILPAFAEIKTLRHLSDDVIYGILLALLVALILAVARLGRRVIEENQKFVRERCKLRIERDKTASFSEERREITRKLDMLVSEHETDLPMSVGIICLGCAAFLAVLPGIPLFVGFVHNAVCAIGWQYYPDAMLLDMVLDKINQVTTR